jgi:toxin YoeB
MIKSWSDEAWDTYTEWQNEGMNRKLVKKINALLKDIERNGAALGIGHPEPLKNVNAWSRHINHEHRLVYRIVSSEQIFIISVEGHYTDMIPIYNSYFE